jgi:hypothetical protein
LLLLLLLLLTSCSWAAVAWGGTSLGWLGGSRAAGGCLLGLVALCRLLLLVARGRGLCVGV